MLLPGSAPVRRRNPLLTSASSRLPELVDVAHADERNVLRRLHHYCGVVRVGERDAVVSPGPVVEVRPLLDQVDAEKDTKRLFGIIDSMTPAERRNPKIIDASRRRRIARGCGLEVQDVNRLIKQFREMQRMMKTLQKTGGRGLSKLFG